MKNELQDIPLSLHEKQKYGYGQNNKIAQSLNPKYFKQLEQKLEKYNQDKFNEKTKKSNKEFEPQIPFLIDEKEKVDFETQRNYGIIKDEIYMDEE